MPSYSYTRCLDNAYKANWKIDDLLGDRQFDPHPALAAGGCSAARPASRSLDEDHKRKLTQIEMASYAHLFSYVEEFVAPMVTELAQRASRSIVRDAHDALVNFAVRGGQAHDHVPPPGGTREPARSGPRRAPASATQPRRRSRLRARRSSPGAVAAPDGVHRVDVAAPLHRGVRQGRRPATRSPRRCSAPTGRRRPSTLKLDHLETLRCFEDLDARGSGPGDRRDRLGRARGGGRRPAPPAGRATTS